MEAVKPTRKIPRIAQECLAVCRAWRRGEISGRELSRRARRIARRYGVRL